MAEDISNSSLEVTLCNLMLRLKFENPNMGRKEMHSAVLAEGPSWEKVTFADVDKTWRRMKKKNAKSNKENEDSTHRNELGTSSKKGQKLGACLGELGACGGESVPCKDQSNKSKSDKKGKSQSSETKEVTSEELERALFNEKTVSTNKKSEALEKQLKMLQENPFVNYIVFTPPYESNDCAIQLSDPMGEIFFNIMWNRVVKAPFGSKSICRELWLIYQQLEFNLMPKYKKMLKKQLLEEFGVDPSEGQAQN